MGAWSFVEPRIEEVLLDIGAESRRPIYVGRGEAAAPATGLLSRHVAEQKELVDRALTVDMRTQRAVPQKVARKSKGKVA